MEMTVEQAFDVIKANYAMQKKMLVDEDRDTIALALDAFSDRIEQAFQVVESSLFAGK